MSSRSQEKRMTIEGRTLKFFREQAKLSVRGASAASGVGDGVINHLENGRIQIHQRHLEKLLPAYGTTPKAYQMFASRSVELPKDIRFECLELVRAMSCDQLRTAHPVLMSLAAHK